jgi:ABC-type branched-subunit amino acid transport system substrate-binding protein
LAVEAGATASSLAGAWRVDTGRSRQYCRRAAKCIIVVPPGRRGVIVGKVHQVVGVAASVALTTAAFVGITGSAGAGVREASGSTPTFTIGHYGDESSNPDPSSGIYGSKAAVKALNKDKSLGFKVKMKFCGVGPGGDTNEIITCAREFAADTSVVAMTGGDPSGGAAGGSDILDQAGIPCISCDTYTAETLINSKHWFQTQIGNLAVGGQAALAVDLNGADSISMPYLDVPAGAVLPGLINGLILKPRGVPDAKSVPVPATAADLSSQVAALGNPDAVVEALTLDLSTRFTTTMAQQGVKGDIWLPAGVWPAVSIKSNLGSVPNKIFVASPYKLSGSGYQQYEKDMKAVGQAGTKQDTTQAVQSWLGVRLISGIISDLLAQKSSVTRDAITSAARADSSVDTLGLTPTLDWTLVGKGPYIGGAVPNLINPFMVGYAYKNGKYAEMAGGKFINVFDPTASASASKSGSK